MQIGRRADRAGAPPEDATLHDQAGYWLWEPATGLVTPWKGCAGGSNAWGQWFQTCGRGGVQRRSKLERCRRHHPGGSLAPSPSYIATATPW